MSAAQLEVKENEKPENEWTIMVFFAGDPHLSPSMTAQLKSLKDAGFQENATVLVHYDPNERGVATTTFEINRKRKMDLRTQLEELGKNEPVTRIGDGKDPFVRNLLEDSINGAPRTANAVEALRTFLDIGASRYPAKHYVVFLVGHGIIVGNDAFLPDTQPPSGITLGQLGDIMRHFKRSVSSGVVELIGMHSCSMSAMEVVYELKGTARYMMATEGVSFVTSWPYRQLLKKILNAIDLVKNPPTENGKYGGRVEVGKEEGGVVNKVAVAEDVNADKLITSIHDLSVYNTRDFMFSGLSADLCLCRLDEGPVEALTAPLENLSKELKKALQTPRGLDLINLAHLEAQSYWQETYTDLYDFCLCLKRRCVDPEQGPLGEACSAVLEILNEPAEPNPNSLIVQSDHFGPLFQYSHGLSIFFPWSRPKDDTPIVPGDDILGRYENYEFTKALGADSWLSFLEEYFKKTKRASRESEDENREGQKRPKPTMSGNGARDAIAIESVFGAPTIGGVDALAPPDSKASPALAPDKASPALTSGSGCICSVKNYPMEFSLSPRAAASEPNADAADREQRRYRGVRD
jgi:Clostripain family